MAIGDTWYPFTSDESFLDSVEKTRAQGNYDPNDITDINPIRDAVTGMTLADYLIQQRSSGATPSFTDDPRASSIDNFVVDNPNRPKTVQEAQIMLDAKDEQTASRMGELAPEIRDLTSATDFTTAQKRMHDLEFYIASTRNQLEGDKIEEYGLNELKQRITALQDIPGAVDSPTVAGQINQLITKYNNDLQRVNDDLNTPAMQKQFIELNDLHKRWTDKVDYLEKLDTDQRGIETALKKAENTKKVGLKGKKEELLQDAEMSIGEANIPAMENLLNFPTKDDLLRSFIAQDPQTVAAEQLVHWEDMTGQEATITSITGKLPQKDLPYIYDLIMDKKVREGNMTRADADTYNEKVIDGSDPWKQLAIARLTEARMQVLSGTAAGETNSDKIASSAAGSKRTISKEDRAQIDYQAQVEGIAKAHNLYKQELIGNLFTEAMSIPETAGLRERHPELFTYPPSTQEGKDKYVKLWMEAARSDPELTPEVVKGLTEHAVRFINEHGKGKLPGEDVISGNNPVFDEIMLNVAKGQVLGPNKMDIIATSLIESPMASMLADTIKAAVLSNYAAWYGVGKEGVPEELDKLRKRLPSLGDFLPGTLSKEEKKLGASLRRSEENK